MCCKMCYVNSFQKSLIVIVNEEYLTVDEWDLINLTMI